MKSVFIRIGGTLFVIATVLLITTVPAHAQTGKALFKTKCAVCHGPDGRGNTPMGKVLKIPDLTSTAVQKQTNAQLMHTIENGKKPMPPYKGKLTQEQIKSLALFIHSLKKS